MKSKTLPFVSIIILNYNSKIFLNDCLNSVSEIDYPINRYEIIVVDNASSDDSVSYIRQNFPDVFIVENTSNLGFSEGNNIGVKKAKGELLFFLNTDTIVDKKCLKIMVDAMTADKSIGLINPKILCMDDKKYINCTGGIYHPWGVALDRGFMERDVGQYNKLEEVDYGMAAALLLRKRVFEESGGFDKDFFAYAEDVNMSITSRLLGYKIIYLPSAIVYHKGSGSFGRGNPRRVFLMTRNILWIMVQNYELKNLILYVPIYVLMRIFISILYLIIGKTSLFFAIFQGLVAAFMFIPKMFVKRKKIQKRRKFSDKYVFRRDIRETFRQARNSFRYHYK